MRSLGARLSGGLETNAAEVLSQARGDDALKARHQARGALTEFQWPWDMRALSRTLRKTMCPILLDAECKLSRLHSRGSMNFLVCLDKIKPRVQHRRARCLDDDPRPRPLPLLNIRRTARPPVFGLCPRTRDAIAAAQAADATRLTNCLVPSLIDARFERQAEAPHRGPHHWEQSTTGNSRSLRWRPIADCRILLEEDALMDTLKEAIEPSEHWISTIGSIKQLVVGTVRWLRQMNGHLMGERMLSPFCRVCSASAPRAAVWCECGFPEQGTGVALLRERWFLPLAYFALPAWRATGPAAPHLPITLAFENGEWLPGPPEDTTVRAVMPGLCIVARAGTWWAYTRGLHGPPRRGADLAPAPSGAWQKCVQASCLGLCHDDAGTLRAPADGKVLLETSAHPSRRRLDADFRRCDNERVLCGLSEDSPLYWRHESGAWLNRHSSPPLPDTELIAVPQLGGKRGARVCVGSTFRDPPPAQKPAAGRLPSGRLRRSRATPFETRLIYPERRQVKRSAGADHMRRVSLRVNGYCVRRARCCECSRPHEGETHETCLACGSRVERWTCAACGSDKFMAVTTTNASEEWICGNCATAPAQKQPPRRPHDAGRASFQLSACATPALSAAWAARVPCPSGWVRASHGCDTVEVGGAAATSLWRHAAARRPKMHCATQVIVTDATEADARRLPVLSMTQDRSMTARVLGQAAARQHEDALQNFLAPGSDIGTPIDAAWQLGGGLAQVPD